LLAIASVWTLLHKKYNVADSCITNFERELANGSDTVPICDENLG